MMSVAYLVFAQTPSNKLLAETVNSQKWTLCDVTKSIEASPRSIKTFWLFLLYVPFFGKRVLKLTKENSALWGHRDRVLPLSSEFTLPGKRVQHSSRIRRKRKPSVLERGSKQRAKSVCDMHNFTRELDDQIYFVFVCSLTESHSWHFCEFVMHNNNGKIRK